MYMVRLDIIRFPSLYQLLMRGACTAFIFALLVSSAVTVRDTCNLLWHANNITLNVAHLLRRQEVP